MISKVEMERFTVISVNPFDDIVAAVKTSVGNPNMAEFGKAVQEAESAAELDDVVRRVLGPTGLMLFVEFDHGMIVRKGTERHSARIIRLVMGNPLIMKEMAKHVPDAGSVCSGNRPCLFDERADGVHRLHMRPDGQPA